MDSTPNIPSTSPDTSELMPFSPDPLSFVRLCLFEIISIVVEVADWRTTVSCALVCKVWSEIALNKIWRKLDRDEDSDGLFALLRPKRDRVTRAIAHLDWDRYFFYARRVQEFHFPQLIRIWAFRGIDEKQIARFAKSCPEDCMLPNATRIDFKGNADENQSFVYFAKFCNQSLRHLEISTLVVALSHEFIGGTPEQTGIDELLRNIAPRSPNLEVLSITDDVRDISELLEPALASVIPAFPRLLTVTLGTAITSRRILDLLSHAPSLSKLNLSPSIHINEGTTVVPLRYEPIQTLGNDAFPSLSELSICTEYSVVSEMRRHACFLKLCALKLALADVSTEEEINALFSYLPAFSNLRELHVQLLHKLGSFYPSALPYLGNLKHLTSLRLECSRMCTLHDSDIVDIVKLCPGLTSLHAMWLHIPLIEADSMLSSFTLDVLSLLSQQPNRLKSFHFYFCPEDGFGTLQGEIGPYTQQLADVDFDRVYTDEEGTVKVGNYLRRCLSRTCAEKALANFVVH